MTRTEPKLKVATYPLWVVIEDIHARGIDVKTLIVKPLIVVGWQWMERDENGTDGPGWVSVVQTDIGLAVPLTVKVGLIYHFYTDLDEAWEMAKYLSKGLQD
jgi:hypothetical protein